MGCGFEPAIETASPWRPAEGYGGDDPTVCIGYTRQLAEVIETARAYPHWDRGALRDLVGKPSRALLIAVDVLHAEVQSVQSHVVNRKPTGGE